MGGWVVGVKTGDEEIDRALGAQGIPNSTAQENRGERKTFNPLRSPSLSIPTQYTHTHTRDHYHAPPYPFFTKHTEEIKK